MRHQNDKKPLTLLEHLCYYLATQLALDLCVLDLTIMDFEPILDAELDLPPEFCHYKDEGCELASSCLNCPFPNCTLDIPRGKQQFLKSQRDRQILERHREGKRVDELAIEFEISQRTVQRILQKHRRENIIEGDGNK